MTASDKRKLRFLLLLLVAAGLTWFVVYRSGSAAPDETTGPKAATGTKDQKATPDAQIRLDLLENPTSTDTVGRRNLFQYRVNAAPAPPAPEPPHVVAPAPALPGSGNVQITRAPVPPPFKAFRYEGFSVPKDGKILASISEGGNSYTVREGECLMGQYCVRRLTEDLIEIEDLQLKSSQTFTRIQQ